MKKKSSTKRTVKKSTIRLALKAKGKRLVHGYEVKTRKRK